MKKISLVRDYLSFNRTELRGIFVLLSILAGLITVHVLLPAGQWQKPIDFTSFEKEAKSFEEAWEKAGEEEKALRYRPGKFQKALLPRNHDSSDRSEHAKIIPFTIDINSADSFDLQRLRGIGPAFARRIISHRERLGGFLYPKQLLEVWGMDTSRFAMIVKNICVGVDSIRKIDLNLVTFKELLRHPYFPFELTKSILLYRQKHKRFNSFEELRVIPEVTDSVFRRIAPYIRISP